MAGRPARRDSQLPVRDSGVRGEHRAARTTLGRSPVWCWTWCGTSASRPCVRARLCSTAQPIRGSSRDELATAMVATGFGYDAPVRERQAAVLARLLPRVRDIRRVGAAALDLAWCACGRFDAYYERGVKPWDVAAGSLDLLAGGARGAGPSRVGGRSRGAAGRAAGDRGGAGAARARVAVAGP